jgi:hypothetical protein
MYIYSKNFTTSAQTSTVLQIIKVKGKGSWCSAKAPWQPVTYVEGYATNYPPTGLFKQETFSTSGKYSWPGAV